MSEHNKHGSSKLAADLILGPDGELSAEPTTNEDAGQSPLDPSSFASPRAPDSDDVPGLPTERIDLEGWGAQQDGAFLPLLDDALYGAAQAPPLAPDVDPSPAPLDPLESFPSLPVSTVPAEAPPPRLPPERPARGAPLPTGLAPDVDDSGERSYAALAAHGIHALPIDAAAAKAERSVALPCNLLVAAPDLRVAAQTAARLMERGYTCRVVNLDGIAIATQEQAFDAAVYEISNADVHRDQGAAALAPFVRFSGPIILVSGLPLELESLETEARVRGVVETPFEVESLVIAIEEAREDDAIAAEEAATPQTRFELVVNMVRAQVKFDEEQVTRGRVRVLSYEGDMVLDTREPLPRGTKIAARFRTQDGREIEVAGKVVETEGTTAEVRLTLPEVDKLILRQFVDEARDVTTPGVEQVVIRAQPPSGGAVDPAVDQQALRAHWLRVRDHLDDDDLQQVFIKSCLEAKQVDFAVRCYRELKEAQPENALVQKYLNQVGTILGFYAFRKDTATNEKEGRMPTMWKVTLGLFVLMVFVLWIMGTLLT